MTKSLKKQILQQKKATFIKNFDIVLIFTILEKPEKNRQLIKVFFSENVRSNKSDLLSNEGLPFTLEKPMESNKNIELSLKKAESFSCGGLDKALQSKGQDKEKKYKINPILHINNKSLQSLSKNYPPFYGPVILIGFSSSENAEKTFMYLKSLFKIGFLGGFYKGEFLTKRVLKALCFNISRKKEVYKNFLRIFLFIPYKNYKTIQKTNLKFTYLCQNLNLLKKKITY